MTNGGIAILILIGLGSAGWLYDGVVARLEAEGRDKGYRGLLVVPVALLAVLGVWAIAGQVAAWWAFWCLVAVGLKPVIGDIKRHTDQRTKEEKRSALGNFRQLRKLTEASGELAESLTVLSGEGGQHGNDK